MWNKDKNNIYGDSRCSYCKEPNEDYKHIFYECKRIKESWNIVKEFIEKGAAKKRLENTTELNIKDIYGMLNKYKGTIPASNTIHALALWNIYRARTESSLSNTNLNGTELFHRFEGLLREKISQDYQNQTLNKFKRTWLKVKCSWFSFDPGDEF
ncbi:hypothetical protein AX774_g7058 [Zancudomyces culisetae]|uniref:Reverse transcriptase zinc-binding domain-containing protein n=1 Tax=Zancudomyces culisetae TaxID=1213189 RepID=A0A1R1PEZ2_ZANCU|nr:hypothetical protein AX774_g7058 [Zancudomyces culisetae]|eukprot:OMH79526.1 hypothetical protein AX774_g7058 [Zancudomyces culisetae]